MFKPLLLISAVLLLAIPTAATAQDDAGTTTTTTTTKDARPALYDEKADAKAQIQAATAKARRDSRRVLVMFGFNACGWCHKLHSLFDSDPDARKLLEEEYVPVLVDIAAPNAEALLDRAKAALSREELQKGVGFPFLAVLDGNGQVVTAQRTEPLEEGDHHDPDKVKAFLQGQAAPRVATTIYEESLARAASEEKLVFLHFGSPTCGWCHKLEAFLAREDMMALLGNQFVDAKLDLARHQGSEDYLKRYKAESAGVPWFAFLDAKGEVLATSDGPQGNVGFPVAPEEISHFVAMLKKAARKLTPEQIDAVEAALKASAKGIEAARGVR